MQWSTWVKIPNLAGYLANSQKKKKMKFLLLSSSHMKEGEIISCLFSYILPHSKQYAKLSEILSLLEVTVVSHTDFLTFSASWRSQPTSGEHHMHFHQKILTFHPSSAARISVSSSKRRSVLRANQGDLCRVLGTVPGVQPTFNGYYFQ